MSGDARFSAIDELRNILGHRLSGRRSVRSSGTLHEDGTHTTDFHEETWHIPGAAVSLTFDPDMLQRVLDDIAVLVKTLTEASLNSAKSHTPATVRRHDACASTRHHTAQPAAIPAAVPALFVPNAKAADRFFDFFTSNIRNKNTRRAYYNAVCQFSEWCEGRGVRDLAQVKPMHIAAFIEGLSLRNPRAKDFPSPP